jgi:hypothetical protein
MDVLESPKSIASNILNYGYENAISGDYFIDSIN